MRPRVDAQKRFYLLPPLINAVNLTSFTMINTYPHTPP